MINKIAFFSRIPDRINDPGYFTEKTISISKMLPMGLLNAPMGLLTVAC